jgi:hypothetical protein
MSKTTKSILVCVLLGSTLASPAVAASVIDAPRHFSHLRGALAAHFAEKYSVPVRTRIRKSATKPAIHKPSRLHPGYTIIDVPDADPVLYGTRLFSINESGVVSGQYMDSDGLLHAFLCTPDGDVTPITVNGSFTFGGYVNDKGWTSGSYIEDDTGLEAAWIRRPNGKIEIYQAPNAMGGTSTEVLNNKGVQEGEYWDDNGASHGYIRARDGSFTEFDAPDAGNDVDQGTLALGINENGDVTGSAVDSTYVMHGYIRSADGSFTAFDVPGAGSGENQGTLAIEIDDKGVVTGGYVDANDVSHAFIRDPDGNVTTFDALDAGTGPGQGTGGEHREGGWTIGEYSDSIDVFHGYYRKANGKIVEFDPPGSGSSAFLGAFAVWSSNRDHLIAGSFKDDDGIRHGFIRNP